MFPPSTLAGGEVVVLCAVLLMLGCPLWSVLESLMAVGDRYSFLLAFPFFLAAFLLPFVIIL